MSKRASAERELDGNETQKDSDLQAARSRAGQLRWRWAGTRVNGHIVQGPTRSAEWWEGAWCYQAYQEGAADVRQVLVICRCGWAVNIHWGEAESYKQKHENFCKEGVEIGGPIGGV